MKVQWAIFNDRQDDLSIKVEDRFVSNLARKVASELGDDCKPTPKQSTTSKGYMYNFKLLRERIEA